MSCHIISCDDENMGSSSTTAATLSGHPFLYSSLGVSNEALGADQLSGPASRMPQRHQSWIHGRLGFIGIQWITVWKSMEIPNILGSKPLTDRYDHQPSGFFQNGFWCFFEHCSTTRCPNLMPLTFHIPTVRPWAGPTQSANGCTGRGGAGPWPQWSKLGLHCITLWANNRVTKCY